MLKIKQLANIKRKAKNKNAKYKYVTKKTISHTNNKGTIEKKYSYKRKVTTANGKTRYYYA